MQCVGFFSCKHTYMSRYHDSIFAIIITKNAITKNRIYKPQEESYGQRFKNGSIYFQVIGKERQVIYEL